ncbi:substrate-binding domain-containing protein [Cellulosilyticum ruminicola]|uniref:substrate-binding domain-containing protein n=1 Tax=Cellulosilyticum ruminicola TaxID=425254 RepID=UPI001FA73779|nr:substrate-binding domain-containing protein [Cellulosilyticum ruminicola]
MVDNDNFGATYEITEELIKKGHERIAFVSAKKKWTVSKDRLEGYKRALETHGIEYNSALVYHGDDFTEEEGAKAMEEMLVAQLPTAIIATDDLMAIGVSKYLEDKEIKGKAVIGFNNTVLAEYQRPSLSSVEIYGNKLGYAAAKLLVEYLENNEKKHEHAIIETKLIRRETFK